MTTGRAENAVQILIVLVIGGMAGAASFTHVHDWTMHNSPAGTGGWYGWANAVISELTPTAAGLEIRRRKRRHRGVGYPMAVLIAAAILSLAAQVAEARPSITGWLIAAVPALAFLALTKLILSRATTSTTEGTEGDAPCATATTPTATSARTAENPTSTPTAAPAASTPTLDPPPAQLLTSARMAAFAHHQATGQPITPSGLAAHLAIPPALAGTLLDHLDGTGILGTSPSPVTAVNGTPAPGGRP
jgi:hypothetical protein